MGGVPREQKMLKGYLPSVIHHQVYYEDKNKQVTSGGASQMSTCASKTLYWARPICVQIHSTNSQFAIPRIRDSANRYTYGKSRVYIQVGRAQYSFFGRARTNLGRTERPGVCGSVELMRFRRTPRSKSAPGNLIRTSVYDEYLGSIKITTHPDHISHCIKHTVQTGRIDRPTEHLSSILAAIESKVAQPSNVEKRTEKNAGKQSTPR